MNGRLILFPVPIGGTLAASLPEGNAELLANCHTFIVEEVRTARRFLSSAGYPFPIPSVAFFTLNEHTRPEEITHYLDSIFEGEDIGLLSEAGLPCVADPGSLVTAAAQRLGIEIVPLVGPSSLMLALMASGFNGQNFCFLGYLPVDKAQRRQAVLSLEQRAWRDNQTQLFIEAPYRNNALLQALLETLRHDTLLCVATDIMLPSQSIVTRSVAQWRRNPIDINKRNTVFLISKS
ncbi:MAG: SAM-dependent methyltransferase [Bacteroidales bacterium]|nr:SAM-dependent methyltransferase [Bacteroidales bacterium]